MLLAGERGSISRYTRRWRVRADLFFRVVAIQLTGLTVVWDVDLDDHLSGVGQSASAAFVGERDSVGEADDDPALGH